MNGDRASDRFSWERALRDAQIPSTAKLCGFVLATYMDKGAAGCWPSRQTVADAMSVSLSTAKRALGDLEDAGWIIRLRGGGRRDSGAYCTNLYVPTIPSLRDDPDEESNGVTHEPPTASNGVTHEPDRGSSSGLGGSSTPPSRVTHDPIPSHKNTKSAGYERCSRGPDCENETVEGSDLCARHLIDVEFDAVEVGS